MFLRCTGRGRPHGLRYLPRRALVPTAADRDPRPPIPLERALASARLDRGCLLTLASTYSPSIATTAAALQFLLTGTPITTTSIVLMTRVSYSAGSTTRAM